MPLDIEFLNLNANRRYPIKEDTDVSSTDDTGVQIPEYLIVDFVLTVPQGILPAQVRLAQVIFAGTTLTLIWRDQSNQQVTSLTVDVAAHTPNTNYVLVGQNDYEAAAGRVIIGDLSRLEQDLPQGAFTFQAVMEPTTVIPSIREVNSLSAVNAEVESARLFGHIRLVAGSNIRLSPLSGNAIRIDALSGDGFEDDCECDDEVERQCVESINGVSLEDIVLDGDDCVEVVVESGRVRIENPCADPCCGCEEAEALANAVRQLQQVISEIQSYQTGLELQQGRLLDFVNTMLIPYIAPSGPQPPGLAGGAVLGPGGEIS